ncbi:uncharacterized protein HMPREF1541_02489 [Cyphellophora europaea CBS 101466]|uniref:Cytochrome oxidase c assembly-domain-containing protein n=1 Tax=Cyphellophora europaea (strain CBS 101466) TaxID=1220924 RepID=W2S401_CYPE1|nr:uncharacterized protein HMPREF1541_02489 [Cyphellophora europaea CBS 101466]ETN43330.1 hypothetical protein HMPREF1541_02489 [Cyphellophora europaea CBS 101466]
MSRRQPSDTFTRFTSNSIHASQKPSSTAQMNGTAPASETPQQKVARLRAELRAQREGGQPSFGDRVVIGGRRWADRLHRGATFALLGFTGITAVVAVYGMFSLVTHSRRQKKAFIDSELDRLRAAQQAFLRGEADAEQLHLLEQERAGEEMAAKWKDDREKQKTRGLWQKAKGVFAGSGQDMGTETPEEAERRQQRKSGSRILEEAWVESDTKPAAVSKSTVAGVGYDSKGRPVPVNKIEKIVRTAESERRTGERVIEGQGAKGGLLDEVAGNAAAAATPNGSGSWFGWLGGKS